VINPEDCKDETKCIDDCECIYCGHFFDGEEATNNDMDCNVVTCPKCGKDMSISVSIEYMCTPIEDH